VFHVTYIGRELRRRFGRTLLTALGLALGVGLVIGIIGVSQGLDDAQAKVLAPLQSVGTDVLVTPRGRGPAHRLRRFRFDDLHHLDDGRPGPGSARRGRQRGRFLRWRPGRWWWSGAGPVASGPSTQADAAAVLNENRNVVTDLASLGQAGRPVHP